MNKINNLFVFNIAKRLALIVAAVTVANFAWGGEFLNVTTKSSDKYAKATVRVNPSASGYVYVDTLATPLEENAIVWPNTSESSIANDGTVTSVLGFDAFTNNTITFNLYAKDRTNAGYVWGGWFCADTLVSTDRIATTTIKAEGTEAKPTTATYEARWLQPKVTKVSPTTINFGEINDPTPPLKRKMLFLPFRITQVKTITIIPQRITVSL